MATIRREARLTATADEAWEALRDFGAAASLFRGVLTDCHSDGDQRTVTFANGLVVTERLVTVDDEARRLVYVVLDGPFTHHNASMQILAEADGSRFVRISDFLPDDVTEAVRPLIELGCAAFRANIEGEAYPSPRTDSPS